MTYDELEPESVGILPVIDYKTFFKLTMNMKEEVLQRIQSMQSMNPRKVMNLKKSAKDVIANSIEL